MALLQGSPFRGITASNFNAGPILRVWRFEEVAVCATQLSRAMSVTARTTEVHVQVDHPYLAQPVTWQTAKTATPSPSSPVVTSREWGGVYLTD